MSSQSEDNVAVTVERTRARYNRSHCRLGFDLKLPFASRWQVATYLGHGRSYVKDPSKLLLVSQITFLLPKPPFSLPADLHARNTFYQPNSLHSASLPATPRSAYNHGPWPAHQSGSSRDPPPGIDISLAHPSAYF